MYKIHNISLVALLEGETRETSIVIDVRRTKVLPNVHIDEPEYSSTTK